MGIKCPLLFFGKVIHGSEKIDNKQGKNVEHNINVQQVVRTMKIKSKLLQQG
jgi:hypothetical protein